jgi:hypothetical protein
MTVKGAPPNPEIPTAPQNTRGLSASPNTEPAFGALGSTEAPGNLDEAATMTVRPHTRSLGPRCHRLCPFSRAFLSARITALSPHGRARARPLAAHPRRSYDHTVNCSAKRGSTAAYACFVAPVPWTRTTVGPVPAKRTSNAAPSGDVTVSVTGSLTRTYCPFWCRGTLAADTNAAQDAADMLTHPSAAERFLRSQHDESTQAPCSSNTLPMTRSYDRAKYRSSVPLAAAQIY